MPCGNLSRPLTLTLMPVSARQARATARIADQRVCSVGKANAAIQPSKQPEREHQIEPRGVKRIADPTEETRDERPALEQREPRDLPPHAMLLHVGAAGLVKLLRRRAPHLATRCLRHAARRHQHDVVGGRARDLRHHLMRLRDRDCARRRVALLGLGHHDQPLGASRGVGRAECRDAALAHAGNGRHRFLDLLRIGVAAGADDDVLDAPGDEDIAGPM